MKYLCDTNFIVRYLVNNDKSMFEKSKKVFDEVKNGSVILVLESFIFTEVVFVLSSFYKIERKNICDQLSKLMMFKGIIADKELLLNALEIYRSTNLHIVDCIIYVKAKTMDMPLLSFDKQLLKVTKDINSKYSSI